LRTEAARDLTGFVEPQHIPSAGPAAPAGPGAPAGPQAGAETGVVFPAGALDQLLDAIRRRGFRLVGPSPAGPSVPQGQVGSVISLGGRRAVLAALTADQNCSSIWG